MVNPLLPVPFIQALSEKMISPRIELGTFCVLSRCHDQLDHETIYEISNGHCLSNRYSDLTARITIAYLPNNQSLRFNSKVDRINPSYRIFQWCDLTLNTTPFVL